MSADIKRAPSSANLAEAAEGVDQNLAGSAPPDDQKKQMLAEDLSSLATNSEAGSVPATGELDAVEPTDETRKSGRPLVLERMQLVYGQHPSVLSRRPVANRSGGVGPDVVKDFHNAIDGWPLLKGLEEETLLKGQMDRGTQAFLNLEAGGSMTEEERSRLEHDAIEGTHAYLRFLEGNLKLPYRLVDIYSRSSVVAREDLLGVALDVLPVAITKFNPTKGWKFSTYATYWIRQALQRECARSKYAMKVPARAVEEMAALNKFKAEFTANHGREPTTEEITSNGHEAELDAVEYRLKKPVRLDEPLGEGNGGDDFHTLVPAITDELEEAVAATDNRNMLRELFEAPSLTTLEKFVLCLRYGLPAAKVLSVGDLREAERFDVVGWDRYRKNGGASIQNTATTLAMGQRRVSALEATARAKIKEYIVTDLAGRYVEAGFF